MKKYFVLIFITALLCFVTLQTHAALTAHLDRSQITEGETVQLIIEATGRVSVMPNTDALEKDFEIMGMISGSRVNIINGKIDSRTTWTISLSPKHNGELTIPPITIKDEQTPTLTLHVNELSTGSGPDAELPVFIETEVDKTDPYVQGMVRYTMRVFLAVNLSQGSLSEPELENALVHRLGEDREYQAMHEGKPYHVIEREFIIFPQTSGDLLIPAPVLNAQIPENISRRDPFFDRLFNNNRPIRLRGDAVMLNVQPRPDQSQSPYWLPAESVQLLEEWQPENKQIAVGDPLTRHITIQAMGVTGEQLPELQFADIDGLKLYPDRSQSNTQHLPQNIQGEKTLRLAYMPTQPGKYTLPEFNLHWWDTQTNQEQIATLPERTIEVIPATGQSQNMSTQTPETKQLQSTESTHLPTPQHPIPENTTTSILNHSGWFWASLLFASLWFITLVLWWRKRHTVTQNTRTNIAPKIEVKSSNKIRKLFLSACKTNDAKKARQYLLQWAALHWPESPPKGLKTLAIRLNNPTVNDELTALDRWLYQDNKARWDGRKLANLLSEFPQKSNTTVNKNDLPNLYSA